MIKEIKVTRKIVVCDSCGTKLGKDRKTSSDRAMEFDIDVADDSIEFNANHMGWIAIGKKHFCTGHTDQVQKEINMIMQFPNK